MVVALQFRPVLLLLVPLLSCSYLGYVDCVEGESAKGNLTANVVINNFYLSVFA